MSDNVFGCDGLHISSKRSEKEERITLSSWFVKDQLLEKISSFELRTNLFEEPNTQLAAAIEKARAWKTARRQARNIAEMREDRVT